MINAIFTEDVNSVTVSGLTQWDYGQQLHISGITLPDIAEVHFSSCTLYAEAITRFTSKDEQNGGYIVDIPNECLREPYDIKAWVYEIDSGQGQTKKEIFMPVFKRSRPKDFVNPPDPAEETLLNEWIEKINENIQDNAEFKEEITASEEQRKTNETARVNAEAARVAAENERVLAENERDTAETARIEAESARASAEQARQTAESARVTAEQGRVTAENGRVSAESTRVSEWTDLKADIEATLQSGVINDETASATTTYSSTKIDSLVNTVSGEVDTLEGKVNGIGTVTTVNATIPTTPQAVALGGNYSGNEYTIMLSTPSTATSEQLKAMGKAMPLLTAVDTANATITCLGGTPESRFPLDIVIRRY